MRTFSGVSYVAIVTALLALTGQKANAQLEQLANRVPEDANAIVIVNTKAVFASPFAQSNGWVQDQRKAHQSGMIALPFGVDWFLMAAEMDFEFMQPAWEIAVAHLRDVPTMKEIAERSGGRLDSLAGTQAVERPNDSYVVSMGPRVVGAMSPANRQHVIRWVRQSRTRKSPELTAYLAKAIAAADSAGNQIVMALDLHGIFAPEEVSAALANSKALEAATADLQQATSVIASLEGIRIEIDLQSPPQCRFWVEFEQDATPLSAIAKPLLLEVLAQYGAHLDDIQQWKSQVDQSAVVLQGELSQSGLRRLLTVLSGPVGPMSAQSGSRKLDNYDSGDEAVAQASQRYFQSVTNYLNDLFVGDLQPQSMHQIKVWLERYARKIEDLDDYQVDQEVLGFGADVVSSLHEIVSVLDRAVRRSDLRESTMFNSGRRRYGRYGTYGTFEKSYVTRDRELVQADEASRGLEEGWVIVQEIRALTAETRQTMSERYGRDF